MSLEKREAEPRRYSVRCEIHQLHYNPSKTSGCVLCKRRRVLAGGRRLLLAALLVPVILFVAGLFGSRESGLPPDSEDTKRIGVLSEPSPPATTDTRFGLDPEKYRDWLVAIESKLYQESPPDPEDVARVVITAQQLADAIAAGENRIVSSQVMMRMLSWAMALDSESDVGYSHPDFSRAREEWESLRNAAFLPAQWFEQNDSRLRKAQARQQPEIDFELLRRLRRVGQDIHHLIAVGMPECQAVGEVVSDNHRDPLVQATLRKWRDWSGNWSSRVRNVSSRMPRHPGFDVPSELVLAYQEMGSALHNLSIVTVPANDYGVPFLYQRESRFEAARHDLREAEDYLSRLEASW